MIHAQKGDPEQALSDLLKARKLDSGLPGIDSRIGEMQLKLRKYEDAEQSFELALERDPDDAEALDGIGVVYRVTNRAAEAVLSHTRSIALVRNRALSHVHLGEALVDLKRIAWAIESFVEAARIAPWDSLPHTRLADVYERLVGN